MKRFTLEISAELHKWLTDHMAGHGITTLSAFIRVILTRFKIQESANRWTDADMKDFARDWHQAQSNTEQPYILQDPEIAIRSAFEKYKQKRA